MIKENEIIDSVKQLVKMAGESCWNKISQNYVFITSDIINDTSSDFRFERKSRQLINNKKSPVTVNEVTKELNIIYNRLYDVNFYVFRVEKKRTLIEIRYYLKDSLEPDYYELVKNNPPMVHCKVVYPPYYDLDKPKFDLNWEHNMLAYKLKMFWFSIIFQK